MWERRKEWVQVTGVGEKKEGVQVTGVGEKKRVGTCNRSGRGENIGYR